jgi:hypothetical protein
MAEPRFRITVSDDESEWSEEAGAALQSVPDTPGHGRFEVTETEDADEWSEECGDGPLQSGPDADTPGKGRSAEDEDEEISPLSG